MFTPLESPLSQRAIDVKRRWSNVGRYCVTALLLALSIWIVVDAGLYRISPPEGDLSPTAIRVGLLFKGAFYGACFIFQVYFTYTLAFQRENRFDPLSEKALSKRNRKDKIKEGALLPLTTETYFKQEIYQLPEVRFYLEKVALMKRQLTLGEFEGIINWADKKERVQYLR